MLFSLSHELELFTLTEMTQQFFSWTWNYTKIALINIMRCFPNSLKNEIKTLFYSIAKLTAVNLKDYSFKIFSYTSILNPFLHKDKEMVVFWSNFLICKIHRWKMIPK